MNYYAVIPSYILSSKLLTAEEKVMCGLIAGLSEKTGYCYAGNDKLSEYLGKSENSTKAIIKRLYNKEVISNLGNKFDRKIKLSYIKSFEEQEETNEDLEEDKIEESEDRKCQFDTLVDKNVDTKSQIDTLKSQIDTSTYIYINNNKTNGQVAKDQIKNLDISFETWWKLWPRKDKKQRAINAFDKLKEKEKKILIPATHAHLAHKQEVNEFFEHGATFLNQKVFNDYTELISSEILEKSETNEGGEILKESKADLLVRKIKVVIEFYKNLSAADKTKANLKPYFEYKTNEGGEYFQSYELEALAELGADLEGLIEIEFQEGEILRVMKGYL